MDLTEVLEAMQLAVALDQASRQFKRMPTPKRYRSHVLKVSDIVPRWSSEDVAEVRVVLSDLALEFNAPVIACFNYVALHLVAPGIGRLEVVAEVLQERALTPEELDAFCYSFQCLNLFADAAVDVAAVKAFTQQRFPPWAEVCFFDEGTRAPVSPYRGPSAETET